MASGTHSCTTKYYNIFIGPFQQGAYNLRDAFAKNASQVAQNVLVSGQTTLSAPLSLADKVSKAAVGILLLIPIVNLVVMAILKGADSQFIYTNLSQPFVHVPGPTPQPNFVPQPDPEPNPIPEPIPQPNLVPEPDSLSLNAILDTLFNHGPVPLYGLGPLPELQPIQDFGLNEEMPQRKVNAVARLNDIEAMAAGQEDPFPILVNRFECHPDLARFDLDGFLDANYTTNEHPSGLFPFIDWAGVQHDDSWQPGVYADRDAYELRRREVFEGKVNEYSDHHQMLQDYLIVRRLLRNILAYFTQQRARVAPGSEQENLLKEQFCLFYRKFIDANNNCVYQVISQMEEFVIDIAISGNQSQGQIPLRQKIFNEACLALCKHRKELLKGILVEHDVEQARQKMEQARQEGVPANSIEPYLEQHMANLERIAMQQLTTALNLEGNTVNAGAVLGQYPGLRAKAVAAVYAFVHKYKPEEYLLRGVAHPTFNDVRASVNRSLEEWAVGHYALLNEDPDGPQLDQRISSGEPNGWPVSMGGGLTPSGTALLMQAAGLIIPNQHYRDTLVNDWRFWVTHGGPFLVGPLSPHPFDQ